MLKQQYKHFYHNQKTHWWFKGMRAINISLLKKYLINKSNLKILDVGCGTGAALVYLDKFGGGYGVDISIDAVKYAKKAVSKKWIIKRGNANNLKFPDSTFDLVVSLDLLYHTWVKDNDKAINEIHRVLKKGGLLLIREPAYQWLRGNEDLVDMTKIRFSKKSLSGMFQKSKWEVKKASYINFFLFPLVLASRWLILRPNTKEPKSDIRKTFPPVNFLLFSLLYLESLLIKLIDLPFGSSVICVAKKK